MNTYAKHLTALSLIAHANGSLHQNEIKVLKSVAKRLSIDEETAMDIINNPDSEKEGLPIQEIDRYVFLDDVLTLVAADGKVDEAEVEYCRQLCTKLGFEEKMVDDIVRKMMKHSEHGFSKNKAGEARRNDVNRLTSKITKYDRHS